MFTKLRSVASFIVLSLAVSSCVVAGSTAGGVVSVNKKQFASPLSDKKVKINASPAVLTELALDGRRHVIVVNGQTAWIDNSDDILATVQLKPRTKPLDLTANSTESNPTSERKWLSIEQDVNFKMTGATSKTYTFTPAYIKEQGRANILPEQLSPYQLPEVQLKSNKITG